MSPSEKFERDWVSALAGVAPMRLRAKMASMACSVPRVASVMSGFCVERARRTGRARGPGARGGVVTRRVRAEAEERAMKRRRQSTDVALVRFQELNRAHLLLGA